MAAKPEDPIDVWLKRLRAIEEALVDIAGGYMGDPNHPRLPAFREYLHRKRELYRSYLRWLVGQN
jgi:hypothetical protein